MDAYLLDTSVASIAWDEGNRAHPRVTEQLAELGDAPVYICAITIGEVEYGLSVAPGLDHSRQQSVRRAMRQYEQVHMSQHVAGTYGAIRGELFRRHSPKKARGTPRLKHPEDLLEMTTAKELGIQENDLWIISVAITYDLTLITQDNMRRLFEAAEVVRNWTKIKLLREAPSELKDADQNSVVPVPR